MSHFLGFHRLAESSARKKQPAALVAAVSNLLVLSRDPGFVLRGISGLIPSFPKVVFPKIGKSRNSGSSHAQGHPFLLG